MLFGFRVNIVPRFPIHNDSDLVQLMAWCQKGANLVAKLKSINFHDAIVCLKATMS